MASQMKSYYSCFLPRVIKQRKKRATFKEIATELYLEGARAPAAYYLGQEHQVANIANRLAAVYFDWCGKQVAGRTKPWTSGEWTPELQEEEFVDEEGR